MAQDTLNGLDLQCSAPFTSANISMHVYDTQCGRYIPPERLRYTSAR